MFPGTTYCAARALARQAELPPYKPLKILKAPASSLFKRVFLPKVGFRRVVYERCARFYRPRPLLNISRQILLKAGQPAISRNSSARGGCGNPTNVKWNGFYIGWTGFEFAWPMFLFPTIPPFKKSPSYTELGLFPLSKKIVRWVCVREYLNRWNNRGKF